jgi:YegS/Rv2252/BmrU family lipid kinase
MKYYFIINPAAGKGDIAHITEQKIISACSGKDIDYEIYLTQTVGDATEYIRSVCSVYNRPCRFYACGGDGTIFEVMNGVSKYKNAQMGIIPIGTGNDFIKNFTNPELFLDVDAQIQGTTHEIDLIKYNDKYCANMINIGFDCEVVKKTGEIKRKSFVSLSTAYNLSVFIELIKKPGVTFSASIDGGEYKEYDLLLSTFANGKFCGGGYKSNPYATLRDGLLDYCLVSNISRPRFISLLGTYKSGNHVTNEKMKDIIDYGQCRTIDIIFDRLQAICIDGEIEECKELHLETVKKAITICLPRGVDFIEEEDDVTYAEV